MKMSKLMDEINTHVYSIFSNEEFTGMMVDRGIPSLLTGWFYGDASQFNIDEVEAPVNKELIKKRMLEGLEKMKKQIDSYIKRINNDKS